MATLQFFPIKVRPSTYKPSTFSARAEQNEQLDAANDPDRQLVFRSTELLTWGEKSVYRGVLEGYHSEEIDAICKLAVNPRRDLQDCFENEARTYQTLRDMQGRHIPTFYGLYEGIVKRDRAVCIIMEDCGDSLDEFSELSDEWRVKAVEILMAIHDHGLEHNDFCPENVVVDDWENPSSIRVIDFEHSTPHACKRQMVMAAYKFPPDWLRFGCPELHNAGTSSCVWTPPFINALGGCVDICRFESAEDLVRVEPRYMTEMRSYDAAVERASADIHAWQERWKRRRDYIDGDAYMELSPAK